jgi:hypothetical protein
MMPPEKNSPSGSGEEDAGAKAGNCSLPWFEIFDGSPEPKDDSIYSPRHFSDAPCVK